jgi:uncharacterized membrane protein
MSKIVETLFSRLVGRLLWRLIGYAAIVTAALIALYHFSIAGTMALEISYGAMTARLLVGCAYAVVATFLLLTLWMTRSKPTPESQRVETFLSSPQNMQIAALLEAAMIGFIAGKKTPTSTR